MCVDTEPDRNYRISAARGAHTNVLTARLGEGDSNYWTGTNREMHTQHKSLYTLHSPLYSRLVSPNGGRPLLYRERVK